MTEHIGSGTAQGLIDYLDSLVAKGRSRQGIVAPLKTALTKVLEKTEGEGWRNIDVSSLDIPDTIQRFKNFTLGSYSDGSYRTYELRIQKAITWYKTFLDNPGWSPPQTPRSDTIQKKKESNVDTTKANTKHEAYDKAPSLEQPSHATQTTATSTQLDAIAYPFPLQNGDVARLYIPKSVTRSDIKRLAIFLDALVIEKEESI